MDIKITFRITLVSGESTTQDITVLADPQFPVEKQTLALMQTMMQQYAQVGILRQPEKGKFVLLCPSQIALVEAELPSIVIASPSEVPKISLD